VGIECDAIYTQRGAAILMWRTLTKRIQMMPLMSHPPIAFITNGAGVRKIPHHIVVDSQASATLPVDVADIAPDIYLPSPTEQAACDNQVNVVRQFFDKTH
jgi:hypothetical protein